MQDEDEEPFIVDYKFIYEFIHGSKFRFLVSSKTLLKNASVPINFMKSKLKKDSAILTCLDAQWFSSHATWYEGFKIGAPSTNNALKSTNRVIKDEHTLRERMPISQFKEEAIRIVRE